MPSLRPNPEVDAAGPQLASPLQSGPTLKRSVGLLGVVMFGAGTAIGVSIFTVLAPAARAAGSGLLIAVCLAAVPMAVFALIYSFLSSMLPKSGASYEWPRELIHPFAGFLVAWLRVLSNVGAIVVLSFALVSYLHSAFPSLPERATMAAAITLVFGLNYLGVAIAARVQTLLMVALLAVFGLFVAKGLPLVSAQQIGPLTLMGWKAIAVAVPLTITLFMGIESAAEIGEEVRDAHRTVPRGIILAVLLTASVYSCVAATALGLIGPRALAASSAPLLDAARIALGGAAVPIMLVAATVALMKTLNSTTLIFSRSIFAMGRSGALPRVLGAVHPRYGTPHVALIVCYLAAMGGLLLPRNLTFLLLSVNIPTLIKYMSSSLCAVRVARGRPDLLSSARIRLDAPTVTAFGWTGIAIGLALLALGLTTDPRPYELIAVWSVLGLLYWWLVGRRG